MTFGYARVSTVDQNLHLQNDALSKYGCDKIIEEKVSAGEKERPGLKKLLALLNPGDTLVVWKLDRLGRSLKHLVELLEGFKDKSVTFISITDSINTTSPTGRFTFNVLASLAQLEREMISERTKEGLKAARRRGRKGGRPPGLSKEKVKVAEQVKRLFDSGSDIDDICVTAKISPATIYRYVKFIKERDSQKNSETVLN